MAVAMHPRAEPLQGQEVNLVILDEVVSEFLDSYLSQVSIVDALGEGAGVRAS